LSETTDVVVAIGASTGGPVALERVLAELPPTFPGVLVTQHMASAFTRQFAEHLARTTSLDVREAKDGDQVTRGRVLVAPGGRHLELRRNGAHYVVRLGEGPPVHHVRPAADVMFRSVARHAGANAIGVVLTGMGVDGAEGLLEMRRAGATTLVQDEDSCVVFGMPHAALRLGAADRALPLDRIARELVNEVSAASLQAEGRRVAL
jgi:two-component system chemotaxis response regulator CheB